MPEPVICPGECLLDRLFEAGDDPGNSSNPWTDYPGGAPATMAAAIARLSTPPIWSASSSPAVRPSCSASGVGAMLKPGAIAAQPSPQDVDTFLHHQAIASL